MLLLSKDKNTYEVIHCYPHEYDAMAKEYGDRVIASGRDLSIYGILKFCITGDMAIKVANYQIYNALVLMNNASFESKVKILYP